MVVVDGQTNLLQMIAALGATGGFTSLLNGRQQQRNQDRNDGNHDEQLDEREALSTRGGRSGRSHGRSLVF